MSLETEATRRDFLKAVALMGLNTLSGILACTQQSQPVPELPTQDPRINDFFTPANLDHYEDLVKKESAQFDLLTLTNLQPFSNASELANISSIIPQERLSQFGISGLAFRENAGDLLMVLNFTQDVRFGKPFLDPSKGTPWPAALFLVDKGGYKGYVTASGYGPLEGFNGQPMEFFYVAFPALAEYKGAEFVIRLSPGLLNVHGNELNSFSIPFKFMIAPPIAPATVPSL